MSPFSTKPSNFNRQRRDPVSNTGEIIRATRRKRVRSFPRDPPIMLAGLCNTNQGGLSLGVYYASAVAQRLLRQLKQCVHLLAALPEVVQYRINLVHFRFGAVPDLCKGLGRDIQLNRPPWDFYLLFCDNYNPDRIFLQNVKVLALTCRDKN